MPQPRRALQYTNAERYGHIRAASGFLCNVFRDANGTFYTDDPRLDRERFSKSWHISLEIRRLTGCRDRLLLVTEDGPLNSPRGAPSPVVTEDLQPPPPPSEKLVSGVADSASALTLQEPDVSSSGVFLDYTSSEESSSDSDDDSPPSASSLGKIFYRRTPKWYQVYFFRTDRSGYFRMYPDLGGPFQSLDQGYCAISQHLAKLQRPSPFEGKDNYSIVDKLIHEHNYYPDGTPKRGPNSRGKTHPDEEQHHLVEAVLDQYNEDNNLFGNLAHGLQSLLRHEWIHEKNRWYYHFNFTTNTGNLFFAEVSQRQGERAWKVNCCCIIDSNENGQCKACRNNGSPDLKHPNNTDAYVAGRLDVHLPFGDGELSDRFDDMEAEDARLRFLYKGLDEPGAMDRLYRKAMAVKQLHEKFL